MQMSPFPQGDKNTISVRSLVFKHIFSFCSSFRITHSQEMVHFNKMSKS